MVLARTGRAGSQFTLLLSLPFFLIKEEESTDGLFLVEVVFIVTLRFCLQRRVYGFGYKYRVSIIW